MAKKKNTRASNGMGSIRQRADGRWEARYTAPDGRQHSLYGKTEKAVTARLRGVLHDLDSGGWREPSKMTVGDWLEIWLADYQSDSTERTVNKYRCICNAHFIPIIGMVKMEKLGHIHIQRVVSHLKELGRAQSTIHNYIGILETALNQARAEKLIRENPVSEVKLKAAQTKGFHIIDRPQFQDFFSACDKCKFPNELKFMLMVGLRVGEVRGLRWEDIDFDAGTVFIQRQLLPKQKNMVRFKMPKYEKTRLLHVPDEAIALLKQQRIAQMEQRIAAGPEWVEDEISKGLVFRQANGKSHSEASISRAVHAVGALLNMPELHPHDLRHSYAVAALRAGADVKTVQHNLGHKTAKMTLDVYAAYTQDAGRLGAEKLSEYLKIGAD